ncbi:phage tail sheath family protein [Thiosocius teredinicola]|uniref:phage tail sheath family protein n=1 Tax=Thiosocius teredinicola TaxID=1973002 RepID=UPI0009911D0A
MPEYLAPGVYVEEVSFRSRRIMSTASPTTLFIGPTARGTAGRLSRVITSFHAYQRQYGGSEDLAIGGRQRQINHMAHAVRAFFAEGGTRLHVVRVAGGNGRAPSLRNYQAALRAVAGLRGLFTLAAPGATVLPRLAREVNGLLLDFAATADIAERVFVLLDPLRGEAPDEIERYAASIESRSAALYYPWLQLADGKTRKTVTIPPSGVVAGVLARVDRRQGIHKAPANEVMRSVIGVAQALNAAQADHLNAVGINTLRQFPQRGLRVWGARTLSSDPEWRYVNVRRYFIFLQHAINQGTEWSVFEPNDEPLWAQIRQIVETFLDDQWRMGRLAGSKSSNAFFVRCDRTTMTKADIDAGRLIVQVGVALVRPAEFVVIRIGQKTADARP